MITKVYGREAQVFPNAVDESVFCVNGEKELGERPYLLMVGGESAAFKGIPDIIDAYEKVKEDFEIDLYWITPEEPSEKLRSRVTRVFVNPRQQKIGSLYRGAAIYVCGSTYENFPLPPLEAMACCCPVVTTNNTGSLEYAVHKQNALICNMKDPVDMAEKIKEVFSHACLKESLITNGLATANQYNWKTIIQDILEYYRSIARQQVLSKCTLKDWDIAIRENDCLYKEDYLKLKKMLLVTNADIIRVPVIYSIDKVPQIARWEVVAIRKNSDEGMVEECYCPVWPLRKLHLYNLKGFQSFLKKQYDQALEEFTELYNGDPSNDKAVWARWIVLTLIRLQRKQEARRKLKDYIKEYPHNADFYKLSILAGEKELQDPFSAEAIKLLGEATGSSEFFYKVEP
ncbi:glycosyltransferase [Bacillus sp. ISL-39]|uniref:glycosyltransferase n=1 Tax=Bacillus sp. ISL-39 TaxID=2819124 RepID=UPI001BE7F4E6|nr:glycosyltransferase [Bacillus sp. ISL-39]